MVNSLLNLLLTFDCSTILSPLYMRCTTLRPIRKYAVKKGGELHETKQQQKMTSFVCLFVFSAWISSWRQNVVGGVRELGKGRQGDLLQPAVVGLRRGWQRPGRGSGRGSGSGSGWWSGGEGIGGSGCEWGSRIVMSVMGLGMRLVKI